MAGFRDSKLELHGTLDYWCVECGKRIEGEPYQASMNGWCCCFDPVYFCSEECWRNSKEFNTDNWPE